ncbi:PREDICTED: ribonuclease H2 subunit C isoform X1 [Poecilia mexicana]|uniref:ribonuclease H2 subunit C isoform X1 n=1 Tax=Poecilia mexicana TaxID=48701 RepID=UPI00072E7AF8|nr:PREDICTED: ribonuclease H2 subunit C isoform X1 [Poecilia mexicana]
MSCNASVTCLHLSSLKGAEKAPVHLMPCEIEHTGHAQVSQYFTATTKENKKGTKTDCRPVFATDKTVSFRGRGLKGQEISCPQGHTGLVLKEVDGHGSDQEDRTVKVTSVFDKLTYWNLETPPTSDDIVVMAMDWPELAEAIHGTIED